MGEANILYMTLSPWSGSWWAVWWHNTVCPPGSSSVSSPRWALTCSPQRPACPARPDVDSSAPQTAGKGRKCKTINMNVVTRTRSRRNRTPTGGQVESSDLLSALWGERNGITSCLWHGDKRSHQTPVMWPLLIFDHLRGQILSRSDIIQASSAQTLVTESLVFLIVDWGRFFLNLVHDRLSLAQTRSHFLNLF